MSYAAWGISWLGSWGQSWGPLHEVDEGHRPRTHPWIKLRHIRDVRHKITGSTDVLLLGAVRYRALVVSPARAVLRGVTEYGSCGGLRARVSSVQVLRRQAPDTDSVGTVAARSGGGHKLRGGAVVDCYGRVRYRTGVIYTVVGARDLGAAGGIDWATAIQNPTDEELAVLALNLLTRKHV